MYNHSPVGGISLKTSNNGSCYLPRYFPTEDELMISWIRIYPCVHRWPFGLNKRELGISCTEVGINAKYAEKYFFGKKKWNI